MKVQIGREMLIPGFRQKRQGDGKGYSIMVRDVKWDEDQVQGISTWLKKFKQPMESFYAFSCCFKVLGNHLEPQKLC